MTGPGLTPVILASLQRVQVVNYFYFVTAAVLVYDHALTFLDELTLVWPARWSFGKALFLLARYPPYIDMAFVLYHQLARSPSTALCHTTFRVAGWANLIGIACTELILIMRTWALWSKNNRIVVGLCTLGVVALAAACYILNLFLESMTFIFIDNISPQLTGCFVSGGSKLIYIAFIILIVFETVVLALTLVVGVKRYRQEIRKSSFLSSLFRDGIMYYCYLFVFSFLNVVIPLKAPRESIQFLIELQRIMHSICGTRILLQIRRAGPRTESFPTPGTTDATLSTADIMLDTLGSGLSMSVGARTSRRDLELVDEQDVLPELEGGRTSRGSGWFGGEDTRERERRSLV